MKAMASVVVVAGTLLSGCAFIVDVEPLAPARAPTEHADLLNGEPPTGAIPLAKFRAQGNNYQNASDCAARLQIEARKVGADAVRVDPQESGLGRGPACSGVAYAIPPPKPEAKHSKKKPDQEKAKR